MEIKSRLTAGSSIRRQMRLVEDMITFSAATYRTVTKMRIGAASVVNRDPLKSLRGRGPTAPPAARGSISTWGGTLKQDSSVCDRLIRSCVIALGGRGGGGDGRIRPRLTGRISPGAQGVGRKGDCAGWVAIVRATHFLTARASLRFIDIHRIEHVAFTAGAVCGPPSARQVRNQFGVRWKFAAVGAVAPVECRLSTR